MSLAAIEAQTYTRGVGVYPGDPKQNWSPVLQPGPNEYRNLALHRPAYQSSSYDYNLTAQLITDGIKESAMPRRIAVTGSQTGLLPKNERERVLDNNWMTFVDQSGKSVWLEVEIAGGQEAPLIDSLRVDGSVRGVEPENQEVTCTVSGSGDGQSWHELGRAAHMVHPAGELHFTMAFQAPSRNRFYRVQFDNGRLLHWQIGELKFLNQNQPVHLGGPYGFSSAWMSAGTGEEWVYVDLGVKSQFDRVAMSWIRRPAEGALQVSDDAANWRTVHALDGDDIKLSQPAEARYVRVLLTKPATPEGYVLSELEVWGRGGMMVRPKPAAPSLALDGGAWKVERDSQVAAPGEELSRPGFDDRGWLAATVPGTVLASYYNAGAVPDPDFGDNLLSISDSFFYADFWYRDEFMPPPADAGKRVWLNFAGINWKADVFLNGKKLGRIEGAFTRARFDVTGMLPPGRKSALAVRIMKNATPGGFKEKTFQSPDKNGGALGADNPTFHASVGWDWIPTIQGRDTGIWNDVFLSVTGGVTIENPWVDTTLPLPDTSRADVRIEATLENHEARTVAGTLRGRFGDQAFAVPVSLDAGGWKTVRQSIALQNPKLWWPNGYGEAHLYDVELKFEDSDTRQFKTGVRQFTYSEEGGALRIWINGRRFVPRGGNWGFSESMLRYRGREYQAAMRYHRDMHFTMVRNWVGQVGEDAFYEAADRNGIVIMQDFWLANPFDGPDPDDNAMFMRNVKDTLLRIRNHPSIGLYCGRNEGYPLKPLDDGIRAALREMHPDVPYIPSSADDVVSGHGPYQAMSPEFYFTNRATTKFHSELGMPNIVTMDSLKAMMPEAAMWPQGRMWGIHDFSLTGAQGGASFRERIEKSYGGANNAADWVELAQFVNYEGYRAMFEAQSKNRMGLLIWMSHPAWPTMVWQTYDYYLEPTAGYFGAKLASEPLHIQWNPATDRVEVVNYSAGNVSGLTATAEIFNMDGSLQWHKTATLDSQEDSMNAILPMEYPAGLSAVHFIRLKLERGGETVSRNFYWRGLEKGNYRALRELPKVRLEAATHATRQGAEWLLVTELRNAAPQPALMVRLKAVREKSGDRILPAIYSDNYIALMPGESRTIRTELEDADTRGEQPKVVVAGFNVEAAGGK
jgi:beta-galactosidase/beta-glucuronidase